LIWNQPRSKRSKRNNKRIKTHKAMDHTTNWKGK
jgi:hypothetical protein